MIIINTSVIKNVFLKAINVIPINRIDIISNIIPKNASLVQNETAYHISMKRYANPPSTAAFIPHFGEYSFSLRHDIARTNPVIPKVRSQTVKITPSGMKCS